MALEDKSSQHHREVVDKFIDPTATVEMATYDYVVRPRADVDTGPIIMTLPRVAEAKGRFYSVLARHADAVNTITITDQGDSECWIDDIVLDGKCDRALLYSDGLAWHPLGSPGEWPGAETTAAPGTSSAPSTSAPTTEAATSVAPTTGQL